MDVGIKTLRTIRYLKFRQILWRLIYFFRRGIGPSAKRLSGLNLNIPRVNFFPDVPRQLESGTLRFTIHHQSVDFGHEMNWSDQQHGRLWNYHLQYLDFLLDENLSVAERQALLDDISIWIRSGRLELEPYPVSLRIVNTLLFAIKYPDHFTAVAKKILLDQTGYLLDHPEYHIDGNHLIENALALRMMACCIEDQELSRRSSILLRECLNEQILPDGTHVERSLGYHAVLLQRMLILYEMMPETWEDRIAMSHAISAMSSCLNYYDHQLRFVPCFGDSIRSARGNYSGLIQQAEKLGIPVNECEPKDSGYRTLKNRHFELMVNAGDIMPPWQPGHAHADMLSFEVAVNGIQFIADAGVSTYKEGVQRNYERSTAAHNTVSIGVHDQSEMWASFRVARRAKCNIICSEAHQLYASVRHYGTNQRTHKRKFILDSDQCVIIDEVTANKSMPRCASFHFHPQLRDVIGQLEDHTLQVGEVRIQWDGATRVEFTEGTFALDFNKTVKSVCLRIWFEFELKTVFYV